MPTWLAIFLSIPILERFHNRKANREKRRRERVQAEARYNCRTQAGRSKMVKDLVKWILIDAACILFILFCIYH